MEICITYGGKTHCFFIPIIEFPVQIKIPGPGPVNYPAFLVDATIVASLQAAVGNVSDNNVKSALNGGIAAAVKAMQAHAGEGVVIKTGVQG
jgi:hypothetical protein